MDEPIIKVENLGKKYELEHLAEGGGRQRPKSLRETLTEGTKQLLRRRGAQDKRRDELWALRDVSFEIRQGEIIGIIGRNGAGKSTLLKILSRITEPTTGRIQIKGRVASLLEVGTGFHPELTGRENIYLNGAILGMTRAEIQRRFDEIVDFAEVERFLDTPVKRFSSGMYVRLAFAVAAHLEPEILIVDEVLAVGDAEFQKKCLGKMGDASQHEGRTVILVSHQMNAVERLCSRALLIDKGRLRMESADVRSVIHSYLSGGEETTAISTRAEWRNTGDQFNNPWFQPQHLFLADARGVPLRMPVALDTETWLHIEADVKTLDPGLAVGYSLYAESGELLYRSYQTDGREEEWPRLQLGRVVLRGRIPLRVLNEGTYRLELSGALHFRQWIFEPGAADPCVFLSLQGGLSESPMWPGKRPGLLAPFVPWELWEQ